MKYRIEVDGLRALALIPVVLFHAGFEWFSGGFVGVDVFFVISGYLITTIIISEMEVGKFKVVNFYERRARRILPALFLVMFVCIPFSWFWLTPGDLKGFGQSLVSVSTFSSNIFFWLESGYFDTATELKPLLHTWSLAVEEQYYIVFPVFILLAWRLGLVWVISLLVIAFLISLGLAEWGAYNKPSPTFYLLPTRVWELLVGVFVAFYLKYNSFFKPFILNQCLSLIGFSMIVFSIVTFDKSTPFPSLYALIPTIGTALLILSAVPNTLVYKLLSLSPIVGVGLISYSAYLWHQPILAFGRHKIDGEIPAVVLIALCLASLIAAYISWHWVERPFRQKDKISKNVIFSCSVLGLILFGGIGFYLNSSDGHINRYSEAEQRILVNFVNPTKYVPERFNKIKLRDFEVSSKKKVVLIGDSFAEDIANALYESEASNDVFLSTFSIPARCGVLMVDKEKIERHQPKDCNISSNFYSNPTLFSLIKQADEVWISSLWPLWTVNYIYESLINISKVNPNIKIFGPKYFGEVKPKNYLLPVKDQWLRKPSKEESSDFLLRLGKLKEELVNIDVGFIDVQLAICSGMSLCSAYDGNDLISFDGDHLTPYGARKLGSILFTESDVLKLVQ